MEKTYTQAPYIQFFGRAQIHIEDESITFLSDKRFFLLAYLGYTSDWVSREQLAFLFWPDKPTKSARKNLRHLLGRVRSLDFVKQGFVTVESEKETLRWLVTSDLAEFTQAIEQENWQAAIEKYQGELLEALVCDATEYSEWLHQARANLTQNYQAAFIKQSKEFEAQGNYQKASDMLKELLKNDHLKDSHLDEDLMQAYLGLAQNFAQKSTQREDALKFYEQFKAQLQKELALEPLPETEQLAQDLKDIKLSTLPSGEQPQQNNQTIQTTTPKSTEKNTATSYNLPAQLTSFVGREDELKEIEGFLESQNLRLLTIIGPGGIGKTRLALQLAEGQKEIYPDGVCYASLASLSSTDNLAPAIASALKLSFSSQSSPEEQLKIHLKDKNLLLILDNLEHVLKGAGIILELLEHCPSLKILTTSREALDFHGEWLYEITGLNTPASETNQLTLHDVEKYEAIQLFIQSAQRVSPSFTLNADDQTQMNNIVDVCRLLNGSPLAIELATNWIRLLNVEEIVEEIQKSLDFLAVTHPDLPERHRSMRAVFDHSWKLLSSEEQTALENLAVFRGGFTKNAAETVGDISLRTLLTLSNKSLLQRNPTGRFERHSVVREFSEEKLKAKLEKQQEQTEKHANYYFDFLEQHPMGGANDQQYLQDMEDELANIRAAWHWATTNKRSDQLGRSTDLVVFYDRRARLKEGAKLFEQAVQVLEEDNSEYTEAMAKACVDAAWLFYRLSEHEQAISLSEKAVEHLGNQNDNSIPMKAFNISGVVMMAMGKNEDARLQFKQALKIAELKQDVKAISNYLRNLGMVEQNLANYRKAKHFYKRALQMLQEEGDVFGTVDVLNNMGGLCLLTLEFQEAKTYLDEGLRQAQDINYHFSIPYLLSNLGRVALALQDFVLANDRCLKILSESDKTIEPKVESMVLLTQGRAMVGLGKVHTAQECFNLSIELAWQHQEYPIVMENLLGIAELSLKQEKYIESYKILRVVSLQPTTEPWVKKTAQELQNALEKQTVSLEKQQPDIEIKNIGDKALAEIINDTCMGLKLHPNQTSDAGV